MPSGASLLAHWYFHVPNLLMVALIYVLLAQAFVSAVGGADTRLARGLGVVTRPLVAVVGVLTPRVVPPLLLLLFAIVWLLVLRMALIFVVTAMGLRPA